MKALKLTILTALVLTSFSILAKDPIKQLTCSASNNVRNFHVTLDPGSYVEGSGFFHPLKASLIDNFYVVQEMVCTGARPGELVCMGYANGVSEIVIEARTSQEGNDIVLHYTTLRGEGPQDKTLKCELR